MSRINSAQQPLFAIAAPIWQGIRESVGSHLPRTELLRRTVPVLIAIFASLAAILNCTRTFVSACFPFGRPSNSPTVLETSAFPITG